MHVIMKCVTATHPNSFIKQNRHQNAPQVLPPFDFFLLPSAAPPPLPSFRRFLSARRSSALSSLCFFSPLPLRSRSAPGLRFFTPAAPPMPSPGSCNDHNEPGADLILTWDVGLDSVLAEI